MYFGLDLPPFTITKIWFLCWFLRLDFNHMLTQDKTIILKIFNCLRQAEKILSSFKF
jgi:hypothetical protein